MPILPNTRCTARLEQGDRVIPVVVSHGIGTASLYLCHDTAGHVLTIHESNLKPMEPVIPPRFKQKLFNSVAPHIGACLANWPSVITVEPDKIAPDTLARRIRDAITAKIKYRYSHHTINEDAFKIHAHEIETSITLVEGKVAIGSANAIRLGRVMDVHLEAKRINYTYVDCTNPQHAEAFFLLLHNRVFDPSPAFIATNLTEQQATSIEARYDIGLNPTEENEKNYLVIV